MKLARKAFGKNLLFIILVITLFTSCQKELAYDNVVTSSPHLTSIHDFDYDKLRIDSFSYNNSGYLIRLQQWTYDDTSRIKLLDSADFAFSFSDNGLPPSSYTQSSMTAGTSNPSVKHLLYYDSKNRIVKDSLLNGTTGNWVVTNYGFGTNYIVADKFLKNNPGLVKNETDSIFISASNNVANIVFYGSSLNYFSQHIFTYNSNLNPCYDKTMAESLGELLSEITDEDFVSQNLSSSITWADQSPLLQTANFTAITDAKGRVIKVQQVGKNHFYTYQFNN